MAQKIPDALRWHVIQHLDQSNAQLADATGIDSITVRSIRSKYVRNGWSCGVRYLVCEMCGKPLALPLRPGHARFHPACRPAARKALEAVWHERRGTTQADIDRVSEWSAETQGRTRHRAVNAASPWTDEDDALVIELADRPIEETCERLGRSFYAVATRRTELRKTHALEDRVRRELRGDKGLHHGEV